MRGEWIVLAAAAMGFSFATVRVAAQAPQGAGAREAESHSPHLHNPIKWPRRDSKTATEQLAANSDQDRKLTSRLRAQGLLPPRTDLKRACSTFKNLGECIAAIHASHNLGLNFDCLKWDLTGVKPSGKISSCPGPGDGSAMSLGKAIHALKPDANAKAEAKNAQKQAHDDIKEASS